MNSKFSAKKACATLMMLMLIMSPLTSLGPKAAMAASDTVTFKDGKGMVMYINMLVKDDNGNYHEAETVIGLVQPTTGNTDITVPMEYVYKDGSGTTGIWDVDDIITWVNVYTYSEPRRLLGTVYPSAFTGRNDGGLIEVDGTFKTAINEEGVIKGNPGNPNFWYNGSGGGATDTILVIKKVWRDENGDPVAYPEENTEATISYEQLLYSGVKNELRLNKYAWEISVPTGTFQNKDATRFMFFEELDSNTTVRKQEFIDVILTDENGTKLDTFACANVDPTCVVVDTADANTFMSGKKYTLTYYNRYMTPYPLEIPKNVGEDTSILDWCRDFDVCDDVLAEDALTFDLYSLENIDEWCVNDVCTLLEDDNGYYNADVEVVATGKLDSKGLITFDNGFLAGWYRIQEVFGSDEVEEMFQGAIWRFVYIDENSKAWDNRGVTAPGTPFGALQNESGLYHTVALDVTIPVNVETSKETYWDIYAPAYYEITKQDFHNVLKQDFHNVLKQDFHNVLKQDFHNVLKQDFHNVLKQDFHNVLKQDFHNVLKQDFHNVLKQDFHNVLKQDFHNVLKQDFHNVLKQDFHKVFNQTWYELWKWDYFKQWQPMFEKKVSSYNDTLVTRLEDKNGGKFGNGMTFLKVDYAALNAAGDDGIDYYIADSSPSNKAIPYTYNIAIGADGKLHLTVGDDRFISASVTAKLYADAPKNSDPSGHTTIVAGKELVVNLPVSNAAAPKATATKKNDSANGVTVEVAGLTGTTTYVKNGKATVTIDAYEVVVEFNGNGVKSATVTKYPAATVPDTGSFYMFVHFDGLKWYTTGKYEFIGWKQYGDDVAYPVYHFDDVYNPKVFDKNENDGPAYFFQQALDGAPYFFQKVLDNDPYFFQKALDNDPYFFQKVLDNDPYFFQKALDNDPYFFQKALDNDPYFFQKALDNDPYFFQKALDNDPYFFQKALDNDPYFFQKVLDEEPYFFQKVSDGAPLVEKVVNDADGNRLKSIRPIDEGTWTDKTYRPFTTADGTITAVIRDEDDVEVVSPVVLVPGLGYNYISQSGDLIVPKQGTYFVDIFADVFDGTTVSTVSLGTKEIFCDEVLALCAEAEDGVVAGYTDSLIAFTTATAKFIVDPREKGDDVINLTATERHLRRSDRTIDGVQGANVTIDGEQGANVTIDGEQGANVIIDGEQGANVTIDGEQGANVIIDGEQGANVIIDGEQGANVTIDGDYKDGNDRTVRTQNPNVTVKGDNVGPDRWLGTEDPEDTDNYPPGLPGLGIYNPAR